MRIGFSDHGEERKDCSWDSGGGGVFGTGEVWGGGGSSGSDGDRVLGVWVVEEEVN